MEGIELCFEVLNNIWFLLITLITAYCYYYLAKQFMKGIKRVWLVGAVYFIIMVFLYYQPYWMDNFSAYAIGALTGFLAMYLLERKNWEQKAFLAVTFFSLRWISLAMENCIDREIYRYCSLSLAEDGSLRRQLELFLLQIGVDLLLSMGIMLFSVWAIKKLYVYKREGITKKELLLLLIPSLSAVMGYEMLQFYNYIYERDTKNSIFDLYGTYNWLCFFYYAVSFGAILVMTGIFQSMKGKQQEERQKQLLSAQIEGMKDHIQEVDKLYQRIRSLQHDMENHIMTLEGLYKREDYDQAEAYARQLREHRRESGLDIKSGNPVTDVILTEKKREAQEKGIFFQSEFFYPDKTNMNAFDLGIILNNALNNAVEGATGCENPYVHIYSYRKKNAYMVEVRNSFQGELIVEEETQLPVTTKEEKEGHGFGLLNIKETAQKYFGDMEISQKESTVTLSVMLMIKPLQQKTGD